MSIYIYMPIRDRGVRNVGRIDTVLPRPHQACDFASHAALYSESKGLPDLRMAKRLDDFAHGDADVTR